MSTDDTAGVDTEMKSVELFGGALRSCIPAVFRDVSDYFPVPDNVEVFQHPSLAEEVFTVELLERAAHVSDEGIGKFFLEDAVKVDANASAELLRCEVLDLRSEVPHLEAGALQRDSVDSGASLAAVPDPPCRFACRVEGLRRVPTNSTAERKPPVEEEVSRVLLAVLRLGSPADTDVVVSLVVPVHKADGSNSPSAAQAEAWFDAALRAFTVLDWGLFVVK